MSELPKGWIKTNLDEFSLVTMGQSPKGEFVNQAGNGIPFYQGKAEFGKLYPTPKKYCVKPTKIADAEDILMSIRAPVGPTNLCPETSCIGRGLASIRAHTTKSQSFLLYYIKNIEPWLSQQGTGTTFKAISGKFLKAIDVKVAPLNEQIRIANKLDSLLGKLEATQKHLDRIPTLLKRFRQSVLAAAVSGELTVEWREGDLDWEQVKLGDVGAGFNYGSSAKSQKTGSIPVLRMGNIQSGKLDWGNLVYTSDEAEISKYELESGDVLFNRTNSPELVGKTTIYRGERKAIYAGYLIRVKGTEKLNAEFLNIVMNSPMARDYCWKVKTDGVSQSNINAQKLRALEFLLPDIPEQKQIVKRVEALFKLADKVEQQYQSAKQHTDKLTQSILAKAFRGELVLQDPNDEPASELLKRIEVKRKIELETKKRTPQKRVIKSKPQKVKPMTLSDAPKDYLSNLLHKMNNEASAKDLWEQSEMLIDDFYCQLKAEMEKNITEDKASSDPSVRLLKIMKEG